MISGKCLKSHSKGNTLQISTEEEEIYFRFSNKLVNPSMKVAS